MLESAPKTTDAVFHRPFLASPTGTVGASLRIRLSSGRVHRQECQRKGAKAQGRKQKTGTVVACELRQGNSTQRREGAETQTAIERAACYIGFGFRSGAGSERLALLHELC